MTDTRRTLIWFILAILASVVGYVGFQGYFSPELLINFNNSFHC